MLVRLYQQAEGRILPAQFRHQVGGQALGRLPGLDDLEQSLHLIRTHAEVSFPQFVDLIPWIVEQIAQQVV
jgi:hypothetical protein